MARWLLLVLLIPLASLHANAVIETYEFSTPELEVRYKALSQELRCPKCQNQNIADSNAPISRDLRAIVHEQLEAGASDEEIIVYLVDRYGEFVRYRPGVDNNTFWLWSAPLILLLMALTVVWLQIRGDRKASTLESNEARARELREKYGEESK
ncbi:MAG: cytochrome c-type biogenesis protein CcmH [Proteobacteria bacterium]|nr:MAG: cytochrome c-type biogenesis protein CcmH [Pseudomonadota bacterium]